MLYIPTLEISVFETSVIRAKWDYEDEQRDIELRKNQSERRLRYRIFMAIKSFGIDVSFDAVAEAIKELEE